MRNYTIGYILTVDGGPQRFYQNTITDAPSQDTAITLFKTVMKYAHITRVINTPYEYDFFSPVSYGDLEADVKSKERVRKIANENNCHPGI